MAQEFNNRFYGFVVINQLIQITTLIFQDNQENFLTESDATDKALKYSIETFGKCFKEDVLF